LSIKIKFLPTAIGSLPHDNPEKAVELVFKYFPDIPVIGQLANVSQKEDMLSQYNENIPGIVFDEADNRWYMDQESETFFEELEEFFLDYESIVNEKNLETLEKYAISEDHCSTLPIFLKKLKETKPAFVKGQITGPFTFGTSLVDREKKCIFYDETLKEIALKGLTLKALWLMKKFKVASPESQPIIFMDEPTMSQYGASAFITVKKEDVINSIKEIASVLQENGALVGIHCCGKSDWSLITESGVDILNFDGFYFGESLSLFSKEMDNFLKKGGKIAWGIVPTLDVDALETANMEILAKKFEEAKTYLVNKGIDEKLINENAIITPSCGAGSLSVEQAEKAMRLTSELATYLYQFQKEKEQCEIKK
jgi:methionine synthase II (cobalamin-independent)